MRTELEGKVEKEVKTNSHWEYNSFFSILLSKLSFYITFELWQL